MAWDSKKKGEKEYSLDQIKEAPKDMSTIMVNKRTNWSIFPIMTLQQHLSAMRCQKKIQNL